MIEPEYINLGAQILELMLKEETIKENLIRAISNHNKEKYIHGRKDLDIMETYIHALTDVLELDRIIFNKGGGIVEA